MNDHPAKETFGRRAAALASPGELLALEQAEQRSERFTAVDELLGDVLRRAFCGQAVVATERDTRHGDSARIIGLQGGQELLDEVFALGAQHARGAWFLPESVRVRAGKINFIAHYRASPRFGGALIDGDGASVTLGKKGDPLFAWALLDHLFETLIIPIDLRTRLLGEKSEDDQRKLWARFDELAAGLELDLSEPLPAYRYGGGWHELTADAQVAARERLLDALTAQASSNLGRRYRAFCLHTLISRYYAKAKGRHATRRQVLRRADERILAGFFGGDWLAFLDYLGEEPAPGEEIVTALPQTRLITGGDKRVAEIAAAEAVPVEEVQRILSALWHGEAVSPVTARVDVLLRFWDSFDALHARQRPGMPALWGLTEEGRLLEETEQSRDGAFTRGLYRKLLPPELIADVERLWGRFMLPRWPDRIVSALAPIELMAGAFGPALHFWHGAALTAWFLCEGPYSRTDMAGLADYHANDLDRLAELNAPVDARLFDELKRAEARLPEPEPIYDRAPESIDVGHGLSISVGMSTRSRREGFETLRDIITRHRREWANRHLTTYLNTVWQSELERAGREYNRFIAERSKPPTAKQFAKEAASATNHWFGGDLSALYTAIGEKSPVDPLRSTSMPNDRATFARAVFTKLGGRPFTRHTFAASHAAARKQQQEQAHYWRLRGLAEDSLRFVQLEEALGTPPTLDQFGRRKFTVTAEEIWADTEIGWQTYAEAIAAALRDGTAPTTVRHTRSAGHSLLRRLLGR
jgi:hypothetical protein